MLKSILARIWSVSKDAAPTVASIFVAASAVSAAWGYYISRHDLREARTLQLVQQFDDARFGRAQDEAATAIGSAQELVRSALRSPATAGLPSADVSPLRDEVFVAELYRGNPDRPPGLPLAIAEVTGFFNGLEACVQTGLCDSGTAHAFFDVYARSFWCSITPVVNYERHAKRRPRFAAGMQEFVDSGGERCS